MCDPAQNKAKPMEAEIEEVELIKCDDIEEVDPFASDTESFISEYFDEAEQEQEEYLLEDSTKIEDNTQCAIEDNKHCAIEDNKHCAIEDNTQYDIDDNTLLTKPTALTTPTTQSKIKVHVPFVTKNWIELNLMKFPCTKEELFEALKEELPATFDSKGNFNGNLYAIEDGRISFVDVGSDFVDVKEILFIHKLESFPCDDVETKDEIKVVELTTATIKDEIRSKSLMRRFKNLWIKNAKLNTSSSNSTSSSTSASVSTESDSDSNKIVFAKDLDEFPAFIKESLEYLRRDEQIQEGLFRLSGTFTRIQSLKERLDAGEKLSQMNLLGSDCHNVTSLLKQFLRNLPQPLLTFKLYEAWQALGTWTISRTVAIKIAKFLIEMLPEVNKTILRDLAKFLNDRLKDSEVTRMNACNYGTVIGPNLLWHPEEDRHTRDSNTLGLSLQSTTLASQIFTLMLQYHDEIFEEAGFEDGDVIGYGKVLYDYTCEDYECEIVSDNCDECESSSDNSRDECDTARDECDSDDCETLDCETIDCENTCESTCDIICENTYDNNYDCDDICDTTTVTNDDTPTVKSLANSPNLNFPTFTENELIFITGIEDSPDGWWLGYLHPAFTPTKFPSNYLKILGQSSDETILKAVNK